jgi:uncharacterized protein YlxW (UPF0749 family)
MLVVTALVTVFVILNWSVFITPTPLSFGFRTVEIPLGMVMLGLTLGTYMLMTIYANHLRKTALIQAGLSAEELQKQRRLADQAEASRFTELRNFLQEEFKQLSQSRAQFHRDVNQRLTALETRRALTPSDSPTDESS